MASEDHDTLIDIPSSVSTGANLVGMHNYLAMWEKSVNDPQAFWMEQARLHRLRHLCRLRRLHLRGHWPCGSPCTAHGRCGPRA